jgi:hypothetical protein
MSDETTPLKEGTMADEPVSETPVEEAPTEEPTPEPTPVEEPPVIEPTPQPVPEPAPKPMIWVQHKAGGEPIQVEEGAAVVELPIADFVPVVPEVWVNHTPDRIAIVNQGKALVFRPLVNSPIAFLVNEDERWAWEGDALVIQRRTP